MPPKRKSVDRSTSPSPRKRKTRLACLACHSRKVQCSLDRPSCEACRRNARTRGEDPASIRCLYDSPPTPPPLLPIPLATAQPTPHPPAPLPTPSMSPPSAPLPPRAALAGPSAIVDRGTFPIVPVASPRLPTVLAHSPMPATQSPVGSTTVRKAAPPRPKAEGSGSSRPREDKMDVDDIKSRPNDNTRASSRIAKRGDAGPATLARGVMLRTGPNGPMSGPASAFQAVAPPRPSPRGKLSNACNTCHRRKVACSAEIPSCEACRRHARTKGLDPDSIVCEYPIPDKEDDETSSTDTSDPSRPSPPISPPSAPSRLVVPHRAHPQPSAFAEKPAPVPYSAVSPVTFNGWALPPPGPTALSRATSIARPPLPPRQTGEETRTPRARGATPHAESYASSSSNASRGPYRKSGMLMGSGKLVGGVPLDSPSRYAGRSAAGPSTSNYSPPVPAPRPPPTNHSVGTSSHLSDPAPPPPPERLPPPPPPPSTLPPSLPNFSSSTSTSSSRASPSLVNSPRPTSINSGSPIVDGLERRFPNRVIRRCNSWT